MGDKPGGADRRGQGGAARIESRVTGKSDPEGLEMWSRLRGGCPRLPHM